MSQVITASRPSGGEILVVDSVANGQINLFFDPSEATASREGNSLVFTFAHGGKIVLNDFFAVGDQRLPDLALPDGNVVATTDFFAGSELDCSTAAGPSTSTASVAGSGSGEYSDAAGGLVSGVDRLGSLGTDYWSKNAETSNFAPAFAPATSTGVAEGGSESSARPEASQPGFEVQSVHYDERFVVTRDDVPVTFGHVLHNDGVADASVIGVRDAAGNFHSLADLAAMNGGKGLETEYGWLRIEDDRLVFEAKSGVDASAEEIVTYVGRNNETGEEYTQNVQIRFSDDDNAFSSKETVDTYYSQNTAEHEMANISLGAGQDRIIVSGKHAEDTSKTIDAGDGHNYIELDSGSEASANWHGGLDVRAGGGNDTVIMNGYAQATSHSSVNIDSGAGSDTIRITAKDGSSVYGDSSMTVKAGKGEDTITVNVGQLANESSTVTIDAGDDNDTIKMTSQWAMVANGSRVDVDAGQGDDIVVISGQHLSKDGSTLEVKGGSGNDIINLTSYNAMAENAEVIVKTGDDANTVRLTANEGQLAMENAGVTVQGGTGQDDIGLSSKYNMAEKGSAVTVNAAGGSNKVGLEAGLRIASDDSKVLVTGGDDKDVIELTSGAHMTAYRGGIEIDAGAGANEITLDTVARIATDDSNVALTAGDGKDIINLISGENMAAHRSTVAIDAGAGNNEITLSSGERIAHDAATVTVTTGKDDDLITLSSGSANHLADDNATVGIVADDGLNEVSLAAGDRLANNRSEVSVTTGKDADNILLSSVNALVAEGSELFVAAGEGNNEITLDSGKQVVAENSNAVVTSGSGDDTIKITTGIKGHGIAEGTSSLRVDAGNGDNEVLLQANGAAIAIAGALVDVETGTGNDDITLSAINGGHFASTNATVNIRTGDAYDDGSGRFGDTVSLSAEDHLAINNSHVSVESGIGNDLVNITAGSRGVSNQSTLTVDTGDGNDIINVGVTQAYSNGQGGGHYLAADGSHVQIDAGAGNDVIRIEADELFFRGSAIVNGGDGDDVISLDFREVNAGTIYLNGGDGNDRIEVLGGNMNNYSVGTNYGYSQFGSIDEGVVLTGGAGADTFAFGGSDDPHHRLSGQAIITDFNVSEGDRLDLSNLFGDSHESLDAYFANGALNVARDSAHGGVILNVNTGDEQFLVRLDDALATNGWSSMSDDQIEQLMIEQQIIILTNS